MNSDEGTLYSTLDEYLGLDLPVGDLVEFMRRRINGSKISPDVLSYIQSFVPPDFPPGIRTVEDLYKIRDPELRTKTAREFLKFYPNESIEAITSSDYLPLDEVADFVMNDRTLKLSDRVASYLWIRLVWEGQYDAADALLRKYPRISIDKILYEDNKLYNMDEDQVTYISEHPSVFRYDASFWHMILNYPEDDVWNINPTFRRAMREL